MITRRLAGKRGIFVGLASIAIAGMAVSSAVAAQDFGAMVQQQLRASSQEQFGVGQPLTASSSTSISSATALANPNALFTLAGGLSAKIVTSGVAGDIIDQIALWPDDRNPTHLIFCNEGIENEVSLQRVTLATGKVDTMVASGTNSCDQVRRTAWGTIIFGEESGGGPNGGAMYELINPLAVSDVVLDRTTGTFSGGIGAENFATLTALGKLSFEGLALYSNGVLYYGDENRPGTGTPGGAYFKFIPTNPRAANAGPITSLSQSPLSSGRIYGLRVGKRSNFTDYGQGTSYGLAQWVPIPAGTTDLRAQTASLRLTGYYRPEDLDIDRAAEAAGKVRFCGPNTGNESDDQYYGEVICITDGTLADATANAAIPEVFLFVNGNPALAMPDNIAYQPGTGNWIIHEDADTEYLYPHNNDLWDCLPDGADDDQMSDGCIRIATLNDLTAEWSGGIFDATGTRFFVSIQHNISKKGTIIEITGWGNLSGAGGASGATRVPDAGSFLGGLFGR